jgi:hypothetical protein
MLRQLPSLTLARTRRKALASTRRSSTRDNRAQCAGSSARNHTASNRANAVASGDIHHGGSNVTKTGYALVVMAALWAAVPAIAGNMGADEAQRFVVGNLFSFSCFEGTSGEGRVYADGSIGGVIRLAGSGSSQYGTLPPGTLRVRGDAICGLITGMTYEVCFDLDRIDQKTFRGSLAAMKSAFCQFTKRPSEPGTFGTSLPLPIQPTLVPSRR